MDLTSSVRLAIGSLWALLVLIALVLGIIGLAVRSRGVAIASTAVTVCALGLGGLFVANEWVDGRDILRDESLDESQRRRIRENEGHELAIHMLAVAGASLVIGVLGGAGIAFSSNGRPDRPRA